MPLEVWIAFAITSAILLVVPGPTVLLVVSYALGRGRTSGWATVPGVLLGDFTSMTASLLGAGAVLAASATAFTALKLAGGIYLVWLGIRLWRSRPTATEIPEAGSRKSLTTMFRDAFLVTALNPKGIVFYVAFVPQFVDPAAPAAPQFVLLEATFLVLAAINVTFWALLAARLRARFQRPGTLRWVNRSGGAFLVGAGVLTATLRAQ